MRGRAMAGAMALLFAAALASCGSDSVSPRPPEITAMTWNVYVGAEIESALVEPDPEMIPIRVAEAWAAVQATSFPERAAAIAAVIAAERPHLVGLQEVSLFRLQSPGDFLDGNPAPAVDVALDFLAILLDALRVAGASYRVAARVENFDLEVPLFVGTQGLDDVRLTDYDVILARSDVATANASSGSYRAHLPVSLAGLEIPIRRGWASVDASFGGRTYRFVNTHLEPADAAGVPIPELAPIQAAQAAELRELLDGFDGRTLLMGDLNSSPDGATTATYADLVAAGFTDLWPIGSSDGDGFTSNQDPDLRNPGSALFHRIDYILYRDPGSSSTDRALEWVEARLVGAEPASRTASGLWPSDHAGVVATLRPGTP